MATSGGQTLGVTISANMDPSGILGAVKQMQGAFNGLKLPANLTGDILKDFNKLQESLKKFDSIAKQDHFNKTDLRNLEKLQKEIDSTFGSLKDSFDDLSGQKFYLEADYTKIKEAKAAIEDLKADIQSKLSEIKIDFSSAKGGTASLGLDELIAGMERGVKSSKVLSAAMGEVKQSLKAGDFGAAANQLSQIITKSNDLKGAGTGLLNTFKQWGLIDFSTPANELVKTKKGADLLATALSKIVPEINKDNEAIKTLVEKLQEATEKKEGFEKTGAENFAKDMSTGAQSVERLGTAFKTAGQSSREMAQGVSQAAEQVKQLQQSTQYFFSLRNMINLLKRGISEAIQTVKELDAAMTETAVVTDFSVGDMWEKLPEYTANANKLGATIQDMYESTTLYYQQGLNTQQSMAIATETMKMARIAGLEAKDATDMMTAALRGFNMELNEASATRINDVYSNLAAKTASDTEEIGKAMQRTASIAHSAGMSFEGTAAFLAQAVETTREPAENIGTAMKTIVARFQEMKKNPLEITEVDGEEVSYNKVDAALQSIGVSLKDTNGQFRELDKVFLDISKRWDGLSQTQQRYIATIAAGSRQQSRFIAMMGDYNRTVELMSYANDSTGASQEQFNKTLDSLEAKLHKLQNAWDQFLMGIMNDSATKFVVDAGTKILDIVNKIINALSFNGELGIVKSLLSIGTAFTALKAGGNIVNKLIGGLGGLVDPTSSFGKGFWGAGKTTAQGTPATGVAGKITTPIVAKLNELIAVTKGNKEGQIKTSSTVDQYKATNQALRKINGMDMGTISALFGGLSDEHAYMAYKNAPGTTDAMKQAALGWLGSKKMPADAQKVGQQLMSAIFKGMDKKEISIKDGMKLIGQPQKWGEKFGTDVAWNFSNSFSKGLTEQANQLALKNLGFTSEHAAGLEVGSDALKAWLVPKSKFAEDYVKEFIKARELLTSESFNEVPVIQTNLQKLANNVGLVGSKFSAAGMSLQMFGAQLGQLSPALEGVGTLLSHIGMTISTFGMGISGLGTIVTKGAAAIKAGTALAVSSMAATPGVIGAGAAAGKGFITGMAGSLGMSTGLLGGIIGAVIIGAIALVKGHLDKKAKEAGEEVRENFEKGFTETNKKIDSLEGYKNRFNELSKGVDQFGHNINLTAEEYDEYLSISRDLQELSPSLISGYNAEGQAILRKGKALDEVIDKLKEERDLSLNDYINNDSVNKLIKAYNTSDAYKDHHTTIKDTSSQNTVASAFDTEKTSISKAIKRAGLEWSDFSQILDELGIGGAESINQLTNTQLNLISDHYTDILNKIKDVSPQIEAEAEEGLKEAFANTNNAIEDVLSEGAPIIEALRQWMGQEKIDAVGLGLGEEFVSGFNSGIEGLILEGLTNNWKPEEYKAQLKDYANEWRNLTGPTSEYNEILQEADSIQQDFLKHVGEEGAGQQYKKDIEDSAQNLEKLANSTDTTTEAGKMFVEQCIRQANALRNYAEEGISLSEALNTMQDDITAAEGALSSFQEATKTDYSTAASGMKGIFDEIFKETENKKLHTEGFGDQTFWKGAKELLSQDIIDTGNIDTVISKLNKIKPALTEGQEGWENFLDIVENTKGMDKWFKFFDDGTYKIDIPEDEFSEVAKQLGVSDNFLTSMLNKGRQFANISFSNVGAVRQALANSDATIKGKNTTDGNKNLYIKEESLRAELFNQGYVTKDDQDRQLATYLKKGIKTIPAADSKELTADKLKEFASDWGIQNLSDLISTLNETGEFTKDEIKAYADKLGLLESEDRYDSLYDSIIEAANNPELARQTNLLETISAQVAALRDNRTSTDAKKDYDDFHNQIYGGRGHDTEAQKFGDGLNKEGKQLSAGEYEQTKKDLEESSKLAREQAALAREKAKTETGLEKEKWENLAKYYDQDADYIDTLLDRGAKAFEKAQKDIDKQLEANDSKAKGKQKEKDKQAKNEKTGKQKADDFYQNRGFGNTDINNRQVLHWGANPSGSNLAAAKTWGFTKEDLQNSVSTYMSSGLTYGQGDNRVELTVTPMLQTEDGTPKVLSSYTVSQYFDKIVSQATNSDGQIDIDKLFELDKEGLEVQGQEINNLLMGAFTGEGAREAATALAELEHQLEEDKIKAQDLNKAANQIGKQEKRGQQQTPKKTETPSPQKVQESKDEGRKQNREIVTTIKYQAEEDPEVEDLNAKYGYDRTTKRIIEYLTKGEKDLQLAEDKVSNIDLTIQEPKQIMLEANTKGVSVAQAALNTLPKTREVKITASLKDFSSKISSAFDRLRSLAAQARDVKIGGTSAAGHNNTISVSHVPTFASAARGKGTVGPKNKGGLTLTGEEGFEIAWLPSAGKSMILGAAGPQMINLPPDAVVYTHEQSKDILKKRQTIPAGSHAGKVEGTGTRSRTHLVPVSSSASKNVANTTKKNQDSIQKAAQEVVKITQKAGTVLVWWENAGRRMDKAQRDAENVQRTLDKLLIQFGTTAEQYQRVGESYESYLKQQISIASEKETKAQQELTYTDLGGTPVAKKTAAEAREQKAKKAKLDKAQKAYKKSKTDKNKKKLEKAKDAYNKTRGAQIDTQNNNYLEAIGARQEISYEVTKRTRDKKGKWKTTKQTKQEKVNLAGFIKNVNGVYTIDQAAINNIAKTNKSRAEAIKQAADKQLTDLLNKQREAEDERIKAEEAIAEFYNSTYETFYAWEKTITTAYLLGKQLEQLSNIRTIFESVEDLEFAKIEAGFGDITNSLPKVSQALEQSRESMLNEVKINRKLIDATFEDYQSALSMESALEAVQQTNSSDAAKDADARRYALKFLEEIGQAENFDYNQAVEELNSTRWNRDDYDKIKDGLDQIADKQAAYYDALAKTYQSMEQIYKTIEEYQSYMSDFEKDLISGIEEQANREIDKLSKLNTSLTDAAKNLIDEVRRKLDERRKQEDNAKTEQDITNKQQRLAALRADTSGGHQVEIAQLEKELAEAQQNYGRTLEDQLLDRMSQQQDEAAKQREQQIQLLEAQRDFAAATGLNIEQINEWLKDPRRNEEQIRAAWLANNNYDKAGALERTQLEEQFNSAWMRFLAYGEALPALADIKEEDLVGTEQEPKVLTPVENIQQGVEEIITLLAEGIDKATIQAGDFSIEGLKTDKNGNARSVAQIKGIMEANGQTVTARNFLDNGFGLSEISKNYSADELRNEKFGFSDIKDYYGLSQLKSYGAAEFAKNNINYADARKVFTATQLQGVSKYAASATKEITEASNKTAYTNAIAAAKAAKTVTKATFKDAVAKGAKAGVNKSAYQVAYDLVTSDGNVSGGITWNKVFKAAKEAGYKGTTVKKWNPKASKTSSFRKAFEKVYGSWSKFATGGLATYTGPAWLDGTPSKPELVLNAKDTQNFIALKDVLSHVMDGVSNTSNTYGDTLYEININVDKIEKDYDVDKVVDKVKKEIIKGAGYRNVTQVRNLR